MGAALSEAKADAVRMPCSNYRQDAATPPAETLPRLEGVLFQNVTGRQIVYAGRLHVSLGAVFLLASNAFGVLLKAVGRL